MNFLTRLLSKPAPVKRRVLDVETVRTLLTHSLMGALQNNYKAIWTKERMAVITAAEVEEASRKAFAPWRKNVWECEDQARSLVEAAQRKAANEGQTWCIGMLHADAPGQVITEPRHVYVWAVIGSVIAFYDPTAREWCERPENIYFSIA
jgi:hypothetical protein